MCGNLCCIECHFTIKGLKVDQFKKVVCHLSFETDFCFPSDVEKMYTPNHASDVFHRLLLVKFHCVNSSSLLPSFCLSMEASNATKKREGVGATRCNKYQHSDTFTIRLLIIGHKHIIIDPHKYHHWSWLIIFEHVGTHYLHYCPTHLMPLLRRVDSDGSWNDVRQPNRSALGRYDTSSESGMLWTNYDICSFLWTFMLWSMELNKSKIIWNKDFIGAKWWW